MGSAAQPYGIRRAAFAVLSAALMVAGVASPAAGQGWGLDATGGEGFPVALVASVAELESELANPVGKRIVVSQILENWNFSARLVVQDARDLTLDCGGWKNFIGASMVWMAPRNVIVRGCRTRNESGDSGDCIALRDASNFRLESFDGAYSSDECIDINGDTADVAIIDSRVGAVLWNSDHSKSPGHSYAVRIGAIGALPDAIVERVLIDGLQTLATSHRVPQIVSHDASTQACIRDSTFWHHGGRSDHGALFDGAGVEAVMLDNNWVPGPESLMEASAPIVVSTRAGQPSVYAEGNRVDGIGVPQQDLVRTGDLLANAPPFSCPDWVPDGSMPENGGSFIQIPPDPTARQLLADFENREGTIGAKDRDQTTPVPPPDILPVPGPAPGAASATALIVIALIRCMRPAAIRRTFRRRLAPAPRIRGRCPPESRCSRDTRRRGHAACR